MPRINWSKYYPNIQSDESNSHSVSATPDPQPPDNAESGPAVDGWGNPIINAENPQPANNNSNDNVGQISSSGWGDAIPKPANTASSGPILDGWGLPIDNATQPVKNGCTQKIDGWGIPITNANQPANNSDLGVPIVKAKKYQKSQAAAKRSKKKPGSSSVQSWGHTKNIIYAPLSPSEQDSWTRNPIQRLNGCTCEEVRTPDMIEREARLDTYYANKKQKAVLEENLKGWPWSNAPPQLLTLVRINCVGVYFIISYSNHFPGAISP